MDNTDFFNEEQPDAVLDSSQAPSRDFDLGAAVERDRVAAETARVDATIPDEFEPAQYTGWISTLAVATLLCALGIGLAAWSVAAPQSIPGAIDKIGLTPFGLIATGAILWALAWIRRQQVDVGNRTDAYVAPLHDMLAYVSNRVESIVEREDFDQSLIALQRLDEKIQNLSRATKMYGKPLMDVASKVQEAANHLHEIEVSLNGVVDQVQSSSVRLGADLELLIDATKDGFPTEQFEALVAATRTSASMLTELKNGLGQSSDPTSSIDQLRGTMQSLRTELDRIAGGLQTDFEKLESKLETSFRTEVGNLGGSLHAKVSELDGTIRGEFDGLGGSLSSLEQRTLALASTASAPVTASASSSTQHTPTPSPQTPQTAPAVSKPGGRPPEGLASSIAGAHKTKGKNVLGAIARLKQMRD